MKTIVAVESMIKEYEEKIKFHKKQLADHESGENRLTLIVEASAEENIIELSELLDKNKKLLVTLKNSFQEDQERKKRIATIINKAKEYKNSKMDDEKVVKSTDKQLHLNEIIDELAPDDTIIVDELSTLIYKSMENYCEIDIDFKQTVGEIIGDFEKLTKGKTKKDLLDFEGIKLRIIILVGKLKILTDSIIESIVERDKLDEDCDRDNLLILPKFEGWWLINLFEKNSGYFSLYTWKNNISNYCITDEQKDGWDILFIEWIYIKQTLILKGEKAFKLSLIFDSLIENYGKIYEEMDEDRIK